MTAWAAFWRLVLGPCPNLVVVWSDGKKEPVGFFASWRLSRPPHLLVRVEWEGATVWVRPS